MAGSVLLLTKSCYPLVSSRATSKECVRFREVLFRGTLIQWLRVRLSLRLRYPVLRASPSHCRLLGPESGRAGAFSRPLPATHRTLFPAWGFPQSPQSMGVYLSDYMKTRKEERSATTSNVKSHTISNQAFLKMFRSLLQKSRTKIGGFPKRDLQFEGVYQSLPYHVSVELKRIYHKTLLNLYHMVNCRETNFQLKNCSIRHEKRQIWEKSIRFPKK